MNAKEKIRQFVIMARHPEAKDYEMALEKELVIGCEILLRDSKKSNFKKYILGNYKDHYYSLYSESKVVTWHEDNFSIVRSDRHIILGRPITALDVCWSLNKKYKGYNYFDSYPVMDEQQGICFEYRCEDLTKFIKLELIKPDGTHTTLEDWSDEVCEKIAELFNN